MKTKLSSISNRLYIINDRTIQKMHLILFFCMTVFSASFSQTFEWAKSMGGSSADFGNSIAVDTYGNVYTTGWFQDTVDFDPGIGTYTLTASGLNDAFISKLDSSGNFLWTKKIGAAGDDKANYIAFDGSGNIYITGIFTDTVDFDPGVGTFTLASASAGNGDIFICKLDTSGNLVWAKRIGGLGSYEMGWTIAIDTAGYVYTAGVFNSTADFDPGTGVYNLASTGSADIFISKLDSSGNFVWAKKIAGDSNLEEAYSIAVDLSGNVYTTGYFIGTVDFDPDTSVAYNLTSASGGAKDIFISKLNSSGSFVWAKNLGASSHDIGYSLIADTAGNVYTTGLFAGTVDFDPNAGTFNLTSAGSYDVFIIKLNASGNLVWAKKMGGSSADVAYSIIIDSSSVYTTGYFAGTSDFDPNVGTYTLTSAGGQDIFISKLDTAGNFAWAKSMGGSLFDRSYSIMVDHLGNVYTTGIFNGTADFDPGTAVFNNTSVGLEDIFVHKMSQASVYSSVADMEKDSELIIAPNPFCTETTIRLNEMMKDGTVIIYNSLGQKVKQIENITGQEIILSRDNLRSGLYFVHLVQDSKGSIIQKLVIAD